MPDDALLNVINAEGGTRRHVARSRGRIQQTARGRGGSSRSDMA